MSDDPDLQKSLSRQGRIVSLVIAGTMLLWMLAQYVDGQSGIETRYMLLIDFFAMAGFIWALVVTWQIWRKRR